MIVRIVKMYFEAHHVEAFLKMFNEKKDVIRNQEGCLYLELLRDVNDPNIMSTYSHWESEAHLDQYRHSSFFGLTWKETKSYFSKRAEAASYSSIETMK